MSKTINVDGLARTSTQYDPVLRMLPYNDLRPRLAEMGFRFISSDKELKEVSYERKGGIARPYVAGVTDPADISELGKVKESKLVPEWGYTQMIEDIMNYEAVNVISNSSESVDPKSKKHPHELLIIESAVKTVNEDILDAVYFGNRDEDDPSPFGLFDGVNTLVDVLIASGEVAAGKGNYHATGALTAPADATDYSTYTKLVNFLRDANWALKKGGAVLKMTEVTYFRLIDALSIKLKTTRDNINQQALLNSLIADSNFPGLQLSVEMEMGSGDRIYLTKPQNFDFSLWTDSAAQFCQVRSIFKNPNLVQYWMQFKAGSRVRQHHAKMFLTNDGTAVANQLSGDYLS